MGTMEDFESGLKKLFGDLIKTDDEFCIELWCALSNIKWQHQNGDKYSNTFRAAGDAIVMIRGEGHYMDWYCTGVEGVVSDRISKGMKSLGWTHKRSY